MNMGGRDPIAFWMWEITDVGRGHAGDWKNPLDGFATDCVTYSGDGIGGDRSAADCVASDLPGTDFMFSIR
jgi:hypothetical protein